MSELRCSFPQRSVTEGCVTRHRQPKNCRVLISAEDAENLMSMISTEDSDCRPTLVCPLMAML